MKLVGDWKRAETKLRDARGRFLLQAKTEVGRIGEELARRMREGLQSQSPGGRQFAPLHPFTIAQKGSSVALAGGSLEKAITAREDPDGLAVSVGVFRDSGMGMIASVHEYGLVIDVTPAMRGYLASQGLMLSPSTTVITIPARPFIRPILETARVYVVLGFTRALRFAMTGRT